MVLIAGIDEAGRGPVIGPLVIAITVIDQEQEGKLRELGVRDSKLLSPKQRESMFGPVSKLCKHEILIIEPKEIDAAVESESSNLNWLEADKAILLLNKLRPDIAFIDCPSNNPQAYTEYIRERLDYKPQLVVEHKADVTYPIVSAASILAKVTRDAQIDRLKQRYVVDFGSGYPADELTQQFLKEHYSEYPFFRRSWAAWKNAANQRDQKKLGEF
ncbi:MAG TPA: ribonuclease HII [Candidatus Nanoarchaeia archaeon]|nr:ribonuclease HII [Candidatus Nanoarchaeia archaeon]